VKTISRLGCVLSTSPPKFNRMKASWKGRHRGGFSALGSIASPPLLSLVLLAIASRRRAARATASFMMRKASRARASPSTIPIPARIRASAMRIPVTMRSPVSRRRPGNAPIGPCWTLIHAEYSSGNWARSAARALPPCPASAASASIPNSTFGMFSFGATRSTSANGRWSVPGAPDLCIVIRGP
jgi:hypothetical protein